MAVFFVLCTVVCHRPLRRWLEVQPGKHRPRWHVVCLPFRCGCGASTSARAFQKVQVWGVGGNGIKRGLLLILPILLTLIGNWSRGLGLHSRERPAGSSQTGIGKVCSTIRRQTTYFSVVIAPCYWEANRANEQSREITRSDGKATGHMAGLQLQQRHAKPKQTRTVRLLAFLTETKTDGFTSNDTTALRGKSRHGAGPSSVNSNQSPARPGQACQQANHMARGK